MTGIETSGLQSKIKALSKDEQRVVAESLPVELLLEVASSKYTALVNKLDSISQIFSTKE